jgi:hypothetical protein
LMHTGWGVAVQHGETTSCPIRYLPHSSWLPIDYGQDDSSCDKFWY